MPRLDLFVSVVAVLHDHAPVLRAFVDETFQVLDGRYANFEIVLVDNGSHDDTPGLVRQLLGETKCLRSLRLSRHMDEETAVMAGLDAAIGDYVVTLHPDFDPPAQLLAMIESCRAGNDVVLGVDSDQRRAGPLYRLLRRGFLVCTRWLIGVDLITGTTGCRALSRHAVNALVRVRRHRRHFALLASDIGLVTAVHPYARISRSGVRPKLSLLHAARTGLSVLVHNSVVPLRLVSVLGLVGSLLSFLYSLYAIVIFLFKEDVRPGWTTTSLQVSGLFFLVFLMLALLAEYLGRVVEESSDRPLYHVREEQSSSLMLTDQARRNVLNRSEDDPQADPARGPWPS